LSERPAIFVRGRIKTRKKAGCWRKANALQASVGLKKSWIAYRKQGQDVGFVYEPVLFPVVDSVLSRQLKGTLSGAATPSCSYTIDFVGKNEEEGQVVLISDDKINWLCKQNGQTARLRTPMFQTEGPYISREPSVHQITIDILDLAINLEEVLSTNLLYDHEKMHVAFDSMSSARLYQNDVNDRMFVASVPEALQASVQLAYHVWNQTLWGELMKRRE